MWPFTFSDPPPAADTSVEQKSPTFRATEPIDTVPEEVEPAEAEKPFTITGWPNQRLTIPVALRIPILSTGAFLIGFGIGSTYGATKAAYRYRAENAHRMPTTKSGWFLYQKTKNYHAIIGGTKEGFKLGGVLIGWSILFSLTEETIDEARMRLFARGDEEFDNRQRDAASTVLAGMSTAGIYSWKRRMDAFTAARTARKSLKFSLLYGLFQDASSTLRGNRPAYIEWSMNKIFGAPATSDTA